MTSRYPSLGRLVTIDYPADPDVTTVYDALGRKTSVTDATGTWAYTYDGVSSRVLTVTDPDENVLSYTYDACGERASMSLTVDGATVTDLDYTWNDGRLTEIEAAGSAGVPTGIFSYSYLANSNLVQTLTQALDVENPVPMTTTRTWDNADRLLSIASTAAVPAAAFTYTLDAQGRRTRRDDLDGTHLDWSYNTRDELTAAVRSGYPASSPFGSYPYTYSYTFDDIGNHLRQEKNGTAFAARYNNLNELLERDVTGPVRVQGTADGVLPIGVKVDGTAAETATVDADTAAWRGDSRPIQPGQTGTKSISVVATDSAQPPKKTESVRTVELPPANPVRFSYDLNGNLTSDGTWTYTWDQENRLVAMESTAAVPAAGRLRLTFTYDSQWRRRTKSVYAWDDQNQVWALTRSHLFLYDGWNLVHEIITDHTQTPAVATAKSYVWGLDLSQTLQGAGGVGGLLSVSVGGAVPAPVFACYDGNGNVTALVSAADGSLAASYDYSPFGETVSATGSAAEANSFRFSTKYADVETGLAYYGFRYLAPGPGRWASRDPLGERGGPNLYCFTGNGPVSAVDVLGFEPMGVTYWLGRIQREELAAAARNRERIERRFGELECFMRELDLMMRRVLAAEPSSLPPRVAVLLSGTRATNLMDTGHLWQQLVEPAMKGYLQDYSDPSVWVVADLDENGYNHTMVGGSAGIADDRFYGSPERAISTLLHEVLHDPSQFFAFGGSDHTLSGLNWAAAMEDTMDAAWRIAKEMPALNATPPTVDRQEEIKRKCTVCP